MAQSEKREVAIDLVSATSPVLLLTEQFVPLAAPNSSLCYLWESKLLSRCLLNLKNRATCSNREIPSFLATYPIALGLHPDFVRSSLLESQRLCYLWLSVPW